jgi:hypothetical protein
MADSVSKDAKTLKVEVWWKKTLDRDLWRNQGGRSPYRTVEPEEKKI